MADDHRPQSPKYFDEGVGKDIADSAECSQGKNYVLYVVGIPPDFDPDGLRNLFSECGKVKKLNLLAQKQPGWAKVGFVEYGTMPEVMKALEMYKSFQIGNYHLRASIARDRSQLRKTNISPSESLKDVDLGELVEKSIEQSAQRAGRRFEKMKSQKLAEKNDIEGKMKPCAVCEKLCLPTCGQCKSVYYCGSSCQREHWHEHKKVCMQKSKNESEQPVDCKGMSTTCEDFPLVEVDSKLVKSVETQMKSIAISVKNMATPGTPKTRKEAKIYECPKSVQPGAILLAMLVDLQSTGIFYLQLIQDEGSILGHLVQTMNEVYAEGKTAIARNVEKGGIYACQFSGDHQWYRAYVQSLGENGSSCNVWYVDFGNCEDVPTANLVELASDFCQIPPHSVRCKLYRCDEIEPTKIPEYIAENIKSTNVEINVHRVDNSIAEVEVFGDFGEGRASLNKILVKMYGKQEKQSLTKLKISPGQTNTAEQNIQKQPTPEKPPPTEDACLGRKFLLKQGTSSENIISAGETIVSGTSGENISSAGKMVMSPPPSGGKVKTNLSSIFQKNKIKPPKPAEIHWDIADVRIPPGQFEAVITHVTGVEEVCCSLLGPGQEILQRLQELLSAYCDKNYLSESFEKGKICASKSSSGPGWYRAEMVSQALENKILVLFVDYGNKESVNISEICKIPRDKKFWELERQAVTCKLQDCEPGGEKFNHECLELLKQCENQMVFAEIDQNSNNRPYPVTIYIDETSTVNSYISDLKKDFEKEEIPKKKEEIPVKESSMQEKKKAAVEKLENKKIPHFSLDDIKIESEGEILITHIESPGNMTFQFFGENLIGLTDLSAKMSQFYEVKNTETTKDSFAIQPGNFYAIKYELDSMWYRAQVLKSSSAANETFEVLFVDYGNVEIVHKQAIKPLMDEFFSLPMQGIKGRLYGCCQNKNDKWSDESTATMQSLQNQKLAALFRAIGQEQEIVMDILVGNGQTVSEVLISAEYVEPFSESPDEIEKNKNQASKGVLNENNPQTAKVSIQRDSPTLLTPPASPPSLSTSAVKSTETSTASKSREKTPDDSDIPSLDHGEIDDLHIKEEEKIPKKAAVERSVITVPNIEPVVGETHSMLMVHANSPDDFYCQIISEDLGEVLQKLEELNAQCCQNPKQKTEFTVGEFCVARASDDKWYRARMVTIFDGKKECSVSYVDYGNEELVSQDHILDLSDEFAAIKSQAVPCSLSECYPVDKEWSAQSLELMKALINQSWQATFEKFNNDRYEVKLFLSETLVLSDYLIQQGLASKEKKGRSPEKHVVQESKKELKVSEIRLAKEEKIAVDVPDSTEPKLKEGDLIHLRIHKAFSPNKMIAMVVEEGKNSFSIRCRMIGIEPAENGSSWTEESSHTLLMFGTELMKAKVIQVEEDDRGRIYRLQIPTLVNALVLSGLGLHCM